ncbi:GntR family transcriptional regulator [Streptacidiphilus sp. N1-10]|uniref:GntR family transcriptional regulator n=1 Tax=Streptacidiphilus jeojiensis TaxID=3229225 RepID=A0ABV6XNG0_9ACTN
MAIIKTEALYKQVANEMRAQIMNGEWEPGSKIPPEEQLSALYAVSRPTVRQAVAALRTEGLLDVQQGRGSFVRNRRANASVLMEQDITRTGARYGTGFDQWAQDGEPAAVHIRLDEASAELLDLPEGEAAFAAECPLIHEASGTRALHRTILPMERITGTPLAKNVLVSVAKIYAILATAHGELEWCETVSARMPQPDERATLHLPEAVPLLISQRVTLTQAERCPLILETTSLGAGQAQFAYTLHATARPRATKTKPHR